MNPPTDEVRSKRPSRLLTLVRYSAIGLLTLVIVGIIARRQIGNLLARQLDERLAAAGVYMSWESAKLVTGPGIRLHDLTLYRDDKKSERIAFIENVTAVKSNRGWDRWDEVAVKMVDSGFTLGSGDNEITLERMNLHLKIQPGRAELLDCNATLQGLRIEAKGGFIRPAAPPEPEPERKDLFADLDLTSLKTVKEWVKFQPLKDQPLLKVEFRSAADGSATEITTSFDAKMFQWRGQEWDLMQAAVTASVGISGSKVEIDYVRIGHAGQTAEISGAYDSTSGVMRIRKFDSGIDALALARSMAPSAVSSLAEITATGQWRITGEGEISAKQPENSHITGSVALDGALGYAAGETQVTLNGPSLGVQMVGRTLSFIDFKAGLWDGSLEIPMTLLALPEGENQTRFETHVTLKQASLQSIMNSFEVDQIQPGTVQVDWKGEGGFDLPSITGSGALAIKDAEFFRIPLLGPLHLVLDQVSPGFGKDVASSLTANHRISDGILRIQRLKLDSKLIRIESDGSLDLNRKYADLTAKAKLQGLAGKATAILTALLEVEGHGPLSDVKWKLKNMTGTKAITGAANAVGNAGAAALGGAGKITKEGSNAAKKLFKLPGKLLPKK